ncbi:hypothetical protein ACQJBY_005763 [Aegilops geniculata]
MARRGKGGGVWDAARAACPRGSASSSPTRAGQRLRRRRGSGGLRRLLPVSSLAATCGSASRWPRGAALQGCIRLGLLCFRFGAGAAVGLRCSGNGLSSAPSMLIFRNCCPERSP